MSETQKMSIVVNLCARAWGVSPREVTSDGRRDIAVRARQASMWIGVTVYGMSQSQVGRLMERDRTTVLYALHRVSERRATDKSYAKRLNSVIDALNTPP